MIRTILKKSASKKSAKQSAVTAPKTAKVAKAKAGATKSTAAKVAKMGALVTRYTAEACLGKLRISDRNARLDFFTGNVQKYSKLALQTLNIEVEAIGFDPELMRKRNFLFICNHLSYTDILVTSSIQPAVFVTSVDMGQVPFLGQMAELGGSLFVERRHRSQIGRDIGVMVDTLRAGHNVMLYPEGTSTNGEKVLPFKKSLLMAAVDAEVDILPICIKYVEVDGQPFGPENRDSVCWYGDMTFAGHFMDLARTKKVKAEIHFLEPIVVTKESTRSDLAEKAHQAISAAYFQNQNAKAYGSHSIEQEPRELEAQ